ncbi:class I SAM-dependent methyltransferase [bacterium]|nr:class I SAM-dependent methyltransferase [candidate division CSSED10-310 bacterium]
MKQTDQDKQQLRKEIVSHFETVAPQYDTYKARADYYYDQLKGLLAELIPDVDTRNVLEIGCGTGALLASLNPGRGLGVDISDTMIALARKQWSDLTHIEFVTGEAESMTINEIWDTLIMVDVLEHLYDLETALRNLCRQLKSGKRMILIWANPLWRPILHALEHLRMKMPEGPHRWEPISRVITLMETSGMLIEQRGTRCLIPARIPVLWRVNRHYFKIPGLKKLGLIQYLTAIKTGDSPQS